LNRKLLVLNLALIAAVIWAGVRVRDHYRAVRQRETAALSRRIPPAAAPPFTPQPPVPPVLPSGYIDVAQKMLLDRSRNSTVVIETAPPPAPKPMPSLPVYHGQMRFPDGVLVILSENATSQHQGIHIGQQIGEFKLVAATSQDLTFEWDGKQVQRKTDELLGRTMPAASAAPAAPAPQQAPPPKPAQTAGPGVDMGNGNRACVAGDSSPLGTVRDGYQKTGAPSPFGAGVIMNCRWEPAK
jgi:hypothetical protein